MTEQNKDKILEALFFILKVLSFIALLLVAFVIAESISDSYESSESECKTQCLKQDMTFEDYNPRLYGSSTCNCKDSEGIIKTIYSK